MTTLLQIYRCLAILFVLRCHCMPTAKHLKFAAGVLKIFYFMQSELSPEFCYWPSTAHFKFIAGIFEPTQCYLLCRPSSDVHCCRVLTESPWSDSKFHRCRFQLTLSCLPWSSHSAVTAAMYSRVAIRISLYKSYRLVNAVCYTARDVLCYWVGQHRGLCVWTCYEYLRSEWWIYRREYS
jgi:hypothetical protein